MENETEKGNITQEKNDFIEKYSGITWSEILQSLAHPHNPDELKAVKIKGDSMKNERINNCDIVLFHPQKNHPLFLTGRCLR